MKKNSLILLALIFLLPAGAGAGRDPGALVETLTYQVSVWPFENAARATVTMKQLGPDRYLAEIDGSAQGLLKVVTGGRRERASTEMALKQGRFVPLIYREESWRGSKRRLKEYRFNYAKGMLELWQLKEGKGLKRKWQTRLDGKISDPLTAFYNFRLGALGELETGREMRLSGIPYPKPEEIVIRVGAEEKEGRRVMVHLMNRAFEDERGVVNVYFNPQGIPQEAWTRVRFFGKVSGRQVKGAD
jgi:hypothetical protein